VDVLDVVVGVVVVEVVVVDVLDVVVGVVVVEVVVGVVVVVEVSVVVVLVDVVELVVVVVDNGEAILLLRTLFFAAYFHKQSDLLFQNFLHLLYSILLSHYLMLSTLPLL
jgi:hypothetical protein